MANTDFKAFSFFQKKAKYHLLPFRFKRIDDKYLLTSIVGEYLFLNPKDFQDLHNNNLDLSGDVYSQLLSKHFIYSDEHSAQLDVLATKYWTKKSFIQGFTKLHIFVLTLRCNSSCAYCQASRKNMSSDRYFDMSVETARKATELMFQSPSPSITVEFQGGEPMLNFEALSEIVLYSEELNKKYNKVLDFVVCTNLSILEDNHLEFFKQHNIHISTSLDGPKELHDKNRASQYEAACHKVVERNIRRSQEALGLNAVAALMTTTKYSLGYAKEIVDEYLRLNLGSIFLRSLNPYGFAVKTVRAIGYSEEEFLGFYKDCLNYILDVNLSGRTFPEALTTLLVRKMLTPWTIGFVDLQSPTGNGFAVTVYNYDGDVYASDESRMLSEMGDQTFRLGNVFTNTYQEIYFGPTMQLIASAGVAETLPGCSDCPYVPYCGADPVRHYATQKDLIGKRSTSTFCQKYRGIFDYLFRRLGENDAQFEEVLWSWIGERTLEELRLTGDKNAKFL